MYSSPAQAPTSPVDAKQTIGANAHFGAQTFVVGRNDAIKQHHRSGVRHQCCGYPAFPYCHSLPNTRVALAPPKAKELLTAQRNGWPRRAPGSTTFSAGNAGSASPSHRCGGNLPVVLSSCIASQQRPASMAPAAPKAWPVNGLVELTGHPVAEQGVNHARFHGVVLHASLCRAN